MNLKLMYARSGPKAAQIEIAQKANLSASTIVGFPRIVFTEKPEFEAGC